MHILEPADNKELRGDLTPEVLEAWEEQGRQGRQGRETRVKAEIVGEGEEGKETSTQAEAEDA